MKLPTDPSGDEPIFHISHIDRVYTLQQESMHQEVSRPASSLALGTGWVPPGVGCWDSYHSKKNIPSLAAPSPLAGGGVCMQ